MSHKTMLVSLVLLCAVLYGCPSTTDKVLKGGEYGDYLRSKGWHWMEFPTQLYGPGTILSLSRDNGAQFITKISSCVPQSVIKIYDVATAVPGLEKTVELEGDAIAKFNHVGELKADFKQVEKARVKIDKVHHQAIDSVPITEYILNNAGSLSETCRSKLTNPNVFMVNEALVASEYSYALYGQSGGEIKASAEKIQQWFDASASAGARATADGKLVFNEPLFYAFKNASGISLTSVGGGGLSENAEEIMTTYIKSNKVQFGQ